MVCVTLDCVSITQSSVIQIIHRNVGLKHFFIHVNFSYYHSTDSPSSLCWSDSTNPPFLISCSLWPAQTPLFFPCHCCLVQAAQTPTLIVSFCLHFYLCYISQGSVETDLPCCGIYNNHFFANCLLSVPVKEF